MIDKDRLAAKCSTWNISLTGPQLDQLDRYVTLGVITDEQAEQIRGGGSEPEPGGDTIATADLDAAYKEGVNSYE